MNTSTLSHYLSRLESVSSRIEITKILAELFKDSGSEEIDKISLLILGSLAPEYKGIVFNLAEKMMLEVLARAYSVDLQEVKKLFREKGDLGIAAQILAKDQNSSLSVGDLYQELLAMAKDEGEGSQDRKIEQMAEIMKKLDPLSARYVARIPVGKLRLGFSEKTILDALSWMEYGDKRGKSKLEQAYQVLPDIGLLAKEVKEMGIDKATTHIKPIVGIPVQAMLCQRLKSPREMIAKLKKVAVEPKLDGLRILIHFKRGKSGFVKAFTRNLHEVSWMFPELDKAGEFIKGEEVILDSEAIGVDETRKALADFQSTMTRRRKHDIEEMAAKLSIQFYVFDILLKDGRGLMNDPYQERRDILDSTVVPGKLFQLTKYTVTDDPAEITKLHQYYRDNGLEGVVVKRYDSAYIPGRTGWRWVKMKEAEEATGKLSDTVDCVIMGYTGGKGKRAAFGIGQFLVGVVSDDRFVTLTKVGTGLSDDQFRSMKKELHKLTVKEKPKQYEVNKIYEPDYWVEPRIVVEIAGDDLTKSTQHTSGYGLRFPRMVRIRSDRSPDEATTVKEIKKLFEMQQK